MSKELLLELDVWIKAVRRVQDENIPLNGNSLAAFLSDCKTQLSALQADAQRKDEALRLAHSHLDMAALAISHKKHAATLVAALSVGQQDRYERRPTANKCACGLHEVPRGVDGVNWYWQRHAREGCALELPNEKCWCGRLRSEHIDGHGEVGQQEKGRG